MLLYMISESFPQNIWIAYHNNNNNLQFFNMNVSVPYELSRFALSFKKSISLQILKMYSWELFINILKFVKYVYLE